MMHLYLVYIRKIDSMKGAYYIIGAPNSNVVRIWLHSRGYISTMLVIRIPARILPDGYYITINSEGKEE